MTTDTTPAGGFTGDPFAALNPPATVSGCCSTDQTAAADNCCATPAAVPGSCCGQTAATAEATTGCC